MTNRKKWHFPDTDWGWHHYSAEDGFSRLYAPLPDRNHWCPTLTTYYRGVKMSVTTYDRYEIVYAVKWAQHMGYACEIWDSTPTCLGQQTYACGPCSPLTNPWRPLRGAAPRYR